MIIRTSKGSGISGAVRYVIGEGKLDPEHPPSRPILVRNSSMRALVSFSIMARFASSRATDARRRAVGILRPDQYAMPFAQKRPIVQMETNALSQIGHRST